jgi:Na+/H+ antiporter NhaD/arsenite permease-like protein
MDLAWLSLAALVVVIVASCATRVNAGLVAIVLAWVIGVYVPAANGEPIGAKAVLSGFPAELFLTLLGVTWLFTQAYVNGTLPRLAARAVQLCRGNRGLVPPMFFLLALAIGSIGPGNIAVAALLAPIAMAAAARAGIPAFLMTIMVAHGANACSLSPFAPAGVVVSGIMSRMELGGHEWKFYLDNVLANAVVAFGGYMIFGGWRLFRSRDAEDPPSEAAEGTRFELAHLATLAVIGGVVVAVIGFQVQVGMAAIVGAIVLTLTRLADERATILAMPWSVIVMVTGVMTLTSLLEKTGGLELFTTLLARFSNQQTITGVIALVTGLISVYSSTSGVVLPTFLPTIPGLVQKLGGGDPLAIASSMCVGGHLVDTSPLSTIGALCVAGVPPGEDRKRLFNQVLAWGLSMALVGAAVCYVFFGLLRV